MASRTGAKYDRKDILIADLVKALSHPARLQIIRFLAKRKTCVCGEIAEILPLSQSTVSQHLKELKDLGIIKGELEGRNSCYCIDREKLKLLDSMLQDFFNDISKYESDSECC